MNLTCACGCLAPVLPMQPGTIGWRGDYYTAACYERITGRPTEPVAAILDALKRKPLDDDGEPPACEHQYRTVSAGGTYCTICGRVRLHSEEAP